MRKACAMLAVLILLISVPAFAQQEDIQKHPRCKYCGMKRQQYAHSRMLIAYEDGTETATCSLHCAALDLALSVDRTPASILVGDYAHKRLIDAEEAYWLIVNNIPGVMTRRAKWAFEKRHPAQEFIHKNGGELVTFDVALKATYEDMLADSKMIRAKRRIRKMHE